MHPHLYVPFSPSFPPSPFLPSIFLPAALEVVNELLAFEKISAGLFTIEPVATSLFPFLKHCMQQHFIPALAKEIKLILTDSMYTEIMVSIDPTKMGIVMRNIISNAIKFSKVGGYVTVMVEVKGFEEGGKVVISVKDSGAGLSATNVTRLFQEGVQFNANALQVCLISPSLPYTLFPLSCHLMYDAFTASSLLLSATSYRFSCITFSASLL